MKLIKTETGGLIQFEEVQAHLHTRMKEEMNLEADTAKFQISVYVNSHAVLTVNGVEVELRSMSELKQYKRSIGAAIHIEFYEFLETAQEIQKGLGIFNPYVVDGERPSNELQWNDLSDLSFVLYLIAPRLTDLKFLINADRLTNEQFDALKQAKKSKNVWSIFLNNASKKTNGLLRQFFRCYKYEDAEESSLNSLDFDFPAYLMDMFNSTSKLQDTLVYLLEKDDVNSEFGTTRSFSYTAYEYSTGKHYTQDVMKQALELYFGKGVAFDNKLFNSFVKALDESDEISSNLDMGDDDVEREGYLNPIMLVHYKLVEVMRIHDVLKQLLESETAELLYHQFLKTHRSKDLYELHDKLSYFHLSLVKNKDAKPFDYTPAQQSLEDNINGIQFVLPETNLDLVYIGETMNHCVATYEEAIREKTTTILSLFDKDECRHILCLEIDHNNHIVQAKKTHNGVLEKDNEADNRILQILSAYVAKNKLIVDTMDLNLNTTDLKSIA